MFQFVVGFLLGVYMGTKYEMEPYIAFTNNFINEYCKKRAIKVDNNTTEHKNSWFKKMIFKS